MAGDDRRRDGADNGRENRGEDAPAAKGSSRRKRLLILAGVGGVLAIGLAVGVVWWLGAREYQGTDDAYVDTNIVHLAPRASGQVAEVRVTDNQPVKAGELLVQLDDSTARAQLASAEASRSQALAQIAQSQAQIRVAGAQLSQAAVEAPGPAAQADNAARDYERYLRVRANTPEAVSQQQVDQARATLLNTRSQFASAEKRVDIQRAQLASARTQVAAASAQLQSADAQIAQARLQMGYARVSAPCDGHVAHKTVALGDYAQVGQELLSIVPRGLWVTANFKETQLKRMAVGQPVELKVDAYPQIRFHGHVDSIQRGAGQSFSVLPAQNATGNFVKVVQRVPVKIVIDGPEDIRHPLGPGMSAEPRVRVGG